MVTAHAGAWTLQGLFGHIAPSTLNPTFPQTLQAASLSRSPDAGDSQIRSGVGGVARKRDLLKAAFGDKFEPSPPLTASEDYSEFINAGVPSMFFISASMSRSASPRPARATARN
jgi:hypothetical protein